MDLASTQNPVHWTAGLVTHAALSETLANHTGGTGCPPLTNHPWHRGGQDLPHARSACVVWERVADTAPPLDVGPVHHLGSVAFTMHQGLVGTTLKPASSIDSLVRVSRRAESGTAAPSSTAPLAHTLSGTPVTPWDHHQKGADPGGQPGAGQGQVWPLACPQTHQTVAAYCLTQPTGLGQGGGLGTCLRGGPPMSHTTPQRLPSLPSVITVSLRPRQAGCHLQHCRDCIPLLREGLSGQCRAGPRSLGMVHLPRGTHAPLAAAGGHTLPAHWGRREGLQPKATAPLTTVPAKASGTSNPLCKVLCTLQSLYFCTIGSMLVFCLVVDTPHTSNCSPKPLYSWIQMGQPQVAPRHSDHKGQSPSVVSLSWVSCWPGGPGACHPLHNPQHLMKPTRAGCKRSPGGDRLAGGIPFGRGPVLPVHSPLLKQ